MPMANFQSPFLQYKSLSHIDGLFDLWLSEFSKGHLDDQQTGTAQ